MDLSLQDGLWWGGRIRLPAWAGYQSRQGAYGALDSSAPSHGWVNLIFAPEGRGSEPLTEQEWALISWFEDNEPAVSAAVKSALLEWCSPHPEDRDCRFSSEEDLPAIRAEDDLKRHVGLHSVNVHQMHDGGVPYIGFEFGCDWDEHGAGVLMLGARVVQIGLAETAILLWIAEQDAEQSA